jgi:hypothetical protein
MTRNEIFLIGAIGAAIYALHKSRSRQRRGALLRTQRFGQRKAKAQWETDGGSPAPQGPAWTS